MERRKRERKREVREKCTRSNKEQVKQYFCVESVKKFNKPIS
jgi:hypothetical protein